MFEELGYKKFYENTDTIRYSNDNSIIIEFRNGMKAVDKSQFAITLQELTAINLKNMCQRKRFHLTFQKSQGVRLQMKK